MAAAMTTFDGNLYQDATAISTENAQEKNNSGLRGIFGLLNSITPNMPTPSKQLEYLFEDEYVQTGPSWGARICYGAGLTYLFGLGVGGTWGLFDGLRNPAGRTTRLRINCIINSCTARGPFVANNLAMVALLYNLFHGLTIKVREGRTDAMGAVGSAAAAGMIYKSTKGIRAMGLAGLILGGAMAVYQTGIAYYHSSSERY